MDEIAAYHDICYDTGKNKGDCGKQMVESLDQIPYGEMSKWGQTARFLINTKKKLGLGMKSKNWKSRQVKKYRACLHAGGGPRVGEVTRFGG